VLAEDTRQAGLFCVVPTGELLVTADIAEVEPLLGIPRLEVYKLILSIIELILM
jgi:hypothetical protein